MCKNFLKNKNIINSIYLYIFGKKMSKKCPKNVQKCPKMSKKCAKMSKKCPKNVQKMSKNI